jgi:ATP-dependent DNA helicase RecQ
MLGYFKFVQHNVYKLKAGDELEFNEDEVMSYKGNKVLKFSKACKAQFNKHLEHGYVVYKVQVKFMLYWFNKEEEKEYLIVIPEIMFDLDEKMEE